MKSIFFCLVLLFHGLASAVDLSWHTDESVARGDAAKLGKPLFIYFTADWCHYCKVMEKETLNTPDVVAYLSKNFVLLKSDYDQNRDLVARFRVRGVPALVVTNSEQSAVEQSSGAMPVDVFMAWLQQAASKISPEALAAEKEALQQFTTNTRRSFREGLIQDQYAAIDAFYKNCAQKEPRSLEFARLHLTSEIKNNPGRFCRFLKDGKLHVRLLTSNAFSELYGSDFDYDPWDLSPVNQSRLEVFLKKQKITSVMEDLLNYQLQQPAPLPKDLPGR